MNATLRSSDHSTVEEVTFAPRSAPVRLAAAFAVLGVVEILVVYLLLQSRLPGQVAWHFGVSGQPDGWETPEVVLAVELAQVMVLSLVFVVMQWWIARSAPLAVAFRGRIVRPLLALQAVIVVGIFPLVSGLLFASAAGDLGISGAPLGALFLVIGLGSAGALLVALGLHGRGRIPTVRGAAGEMSHRARFAVGGPIELNCPACGEQYRLNGVPLFSPHLGVGRVGSLYLRCPRCGELGWNTIVARVAI